MTTNTAYPKVTPVPLVECVECGRIQRNTHKRCLYCGNQIAVYADEPRGE